MPLYFNAADSKNSAREFITIILYTSTYQIQGEISVRVGIRLSDHLNTELSGQFLAVRNAEIRDNDGKTIGKYSFLNISTKHIILVCPLDAS